ncbi:MAG: HigA family addiction module antitoxin [Coriobacteriia bacterium]|nr:HigA family addiction module antitoxin [Coriobacteriia bacterium]
MSVANTGIMTCRPVHPGEILREEFMMDYGLTVATLATKLGLSRQTVNEIVRERAAVTPAMALRLSRLFGTTPELWVGLQRKVDLWDAERELKPTLEHIAPLAYA